MAAPIGWSLERSLEGKDREASKFLPRKYYGALDVALMLAYTNAVFLSQVSSRRPATNVPSL
jgi:hypothetical protein